MDDGIQQFILENEAELVKQAIKDDQAFEILYNHYFPRIYGYVLKRIGNHDIAEDLVSVTFMKVFSNISKYQHKGHTFGAWIYKIATNNLIDYYRKSGKSKEVDIEQAKQIPDKEQGIEHSIAVTQEIQVIRNVIEELTPKKYQEILYLKFFSELSYEEIAEVLGLTVNNSRVQLYRALKKFKSNYEKYVK